MTTATDPLQRAPLALFIRKSGLTIKEVADEMNITRMRMHQIIRDPSRMRIEQAARLAKIIGQPLCTIVNIGAKEVTT